MLPYIEIFGRMIGTYAICAFVGILVSGFVGYRLGRKFKICPEDIILLMISLSIGMVIGGHIMYGITNTGQIIELLKNASGYGFGKFVKQLGHYFGGMVFYGGFFGASTAVYIHVSRSKSMNLSEVFDIFAVVVPLFHMFGRIGCFLGGCCYGVECRWGFIVYDNLIQPEINGVVRMPVQLVEAVCNFLIFLILLMIFKKSRNNGKLIYIYMILYPVVRFIMEFFRGDEVRGFLLGLSTSQWISIALLIFSTVRLIAMNKKKVIS